MEFINIFIIAFILIIFYHFILYVISKNLKLQKNRLDILNYKFINIKNQNCCSGWGLSHFILYTILGYYFPQYFAIILSLGILWEIIEARFFPLLGMNYITRVLLNGDVERLDWWKGGQYDIVINTLGFLFGIYLKSQNYHNLR